MTVASTCFICSSLSLLTLSSSLMLATSLPLSASSASSSAWRRSVWGTGVVLECVQYELCVCSV